MGLFYSWRGSSFGSQRLCVFIIFWSPVIHVPSAVIKTVLVGRRVNENDFEGRCSHCVFKGVGLPFFRVVWKVISLMFRWGVDAYEVCPFLHLQMDHASSGEAAVVVGVAPVGCVSHVVVPGITYADDFVPGVVAFGVGDF